MTRIQTLLGSAALSTLMFGAALVTIASAQEPSGTHAEQAQGSELTAPAAGESSTASGQDAATASGEEAPAGEDRLVATVNDVEIRQSDVVNAIENLPPQVRQMPPQMLLPIVVEQLLTRELIVEQGTAENLQNDPAVVAIVEPRVEALQEQAIVEVWLERELAERITEERINAAYEALRAADPETTFTLETARPQLEQALRQEFMQELAAELREGATIVLYDASGNPIPDDASAESGSSSGQNGSASQGGTSTGASAGQEDEDETTSDPEPAQDN